jgi:hypothetical protein
MSSKPSAKIGELCLLSAVRSAVCAFKIRPLAHMLIQPDFGCFSSEPETYTTPKGTLPLCCRTPATHPSISRFGPPRGLLIQPDFSCVFLKTVAYTTPKGHCVVVHQPHTPPFPDSGRPGACLFNLISVVFSQTQRHIPPPRDTAHCVLSYTSHTPLHFPIRAAQGPGVQRNSGSVNFG